MAEVAPGLHVTRWVTPGHFYVVEAQRLLVGGPELPRAVIVHDDDWRRIAPADREKIMDEFTRRHAEDGIAQIEQHLQRGGGPTPNPGDPAK